MLGGDTERPKKAAGAPAPRPFQAVDPRRRLAGLDTYAACKIRCDRVWTSSRRPALQPLLHVSLRRDGVALGCDFAGATSSPASIYLLFGSSHSFSPPTLYF